MSLSPELKDISYIDEYQQALMKGCRAYFYMRGVEGYIAGRHTPPIYRQESWARSMWQTGHDDAANHSNLNEFIGSITTSVLCRRFMAGFPPPFSSEVSWCFGYQFRLHFEKCYGTPLKDRQYYPPAQLCLEPVNTKPKEPVMSEQLYKVEGTKKMGTRVGEDADGNIVLKISGEFEGFPAEKVSKVMPFTIQLTSANYNSHFKVAKTTYRKGDILYAVGSNGPFLVEVKAVDTECASARDLPKNFIRGFAVKVPRSTKKK